MTKSIDIIEHNRTDMIEAFQRSDGSAVVVMPEKGQVLLEKGTSPEAGDDKDYQPRVKIAATEKSDQEMANLLAQNNTLCASGMPDEALEEFDTMERLSLVWPHTRFAVGAAA